MDLDFEMNHRVDILHNKLNFYTIQTQKQLTTSPNIFYLQIQKD